MSWDKAPGVLTAWEALSQGQQTELLIAYGHYQDGLAGTCSMDEKNQRFRAWLRGQGVEYTPPAR